MAAPGVAVEYRRNGASEARTLSPRALLILGIVIVGMVCGGLVAIEMPKGLLSPEAARASMALGLLAALAGGWAILRAAASTAAPKPVNYDEQIAAFAKQSLNGMLVADAQGTVTWVNDAMLIMTGETSAQFVGRKLNNVLLDSTANEALTPMHELFAQGQPFRAELLNQGKDGHPRWSAVEARALRDKAGAITYFVAQVTDITQHKQDEQALRRESDQAGATAQEKSDLLASMSHEIRTPLMTILGYAEVMLDPRQSVEGQRDSVQAIVRSSEHLLSVINNILDVSKIEAGRMSIERIACSPSRIASDVVVLLSHAAQQKKLDLSVVCAGSIPKKIYSDPTLIRQILVNLVNNAIKFTASGKITIELALDGSGQRPRLRMSVSDTGIGMDAEQIPMLFEPFRQGKASTARTHGGTGLGLHISKRLAMLLGGDITVTSKVGVGSTFTAVIDAGQLNDTEMIERPESSTREYDHESGLRIATTPGHLPGRILVAEDSPDNQNLLGFLMRRAGATVDLADNGEEACSMAMQAADGGSPYDVILMDMELRGMNGYDATQQLRKSGYKGAVVAFTANTLQGDRERCLRAGCNGYLPKPIDCARLLAALEPYVALARKKATERAEKLISDLARDPGMDSLVQAFVARLPVHIEALESAFAARDVKKLKQVAHQLKGVALSYGFPAIGSAATKLDDCCRKGQADENLGVRVRELVTLCKRAA